MKKARAMYIPAGGKTAVWGPVDHNVLPEGYPYKEGSKTVIEWDGNTDGRDSFAMQNYLLCKVSDTTVAASDLSGAVLSVYLAAIGKAYSYEISSNSIVDNAEYGTVVVMNPENTYMPFVVIILDSAKAATAGLNGSEGIYFVSDDSAFTKMLTYGTETIHPMAPEFLPALTSPNGTKYQLTVADDGTLSAVAVS